MNQIIVLIIYVVFSFKDMGFPNMGYLLGVLIIRESYNLESKFGIFEFRKPPYGNWMKQNP